MTVSNQSVDPVTWCAEIPHRDSNPPDIAAYLGAGGTSSICGSPNGTGFGYEGYRDDPETGLYQTGPRHYDLRLRRVLQSSDRTDGWVAAICIRGQRSAEWDYSVWPRRSWPEGSPLRPGIVFHPVCCHRSRVSKAAVPGWSAITWSDPLTSTPFR